MSRSLSEIDADIAYAQRNREPFGALLAERAEAAQAEIETLRQLGAGQLNKISAADARIIAARAELTAALESRKVAVGELQVLNYRLEQAGGAAVERLAS